MMQPLFWARISTQAGLFTQNAPRRCTLMTASHSSMLMLNTIQSQNARHVHEDVDLAIGVNGGLDNILPAFRCRNAVVVSGGLPPATLIMSTV